MKHPKRLFVVMHDSDGEKFAMASEDIESFSDGDKVGVYELVETSELKIRRELKNTKAKKSKKKGAR